MIDAAVNGGIANYQEAFFRTEFAAEAPDQTVYVPQLKALIQEEVSGQLNDSTLTNCEIITEAPSRPSGQFLVL